MFRCFILTHLFAITNYFQVGSLESNNMKDHIFLRCNYKRHSFWSFIRTQGHEWHLYIKLSLNRYRKCDVKTSWSLPIIPLTRETEPSSSLHPAGAPRLASESPAASCQKSWSAFQRSPNIRRD